MVLGALDPNDPQPRRDDDGAQSHCDSTTMASCSLFWFGAYSFLCDKLVSLALAREADIRLREYGQHCSCAEASPSYLVSLSTGLADFAVLLSTYNHIAEQYEAFPRLVNVLRVRCLAQMSVWAGCLRPLRASSCSDGCLSKVAGYVCRR